jgi:rhodanese-related sulfurtransferase
MPEGTESDGAQGAESNGDESVDVKEARREIAGGDATAVDVRSDEQWGEGHIPGAIHLPDGDSEKATKPLEKGARLLVIADNGKLAVRAATELAERGYNAAAVDGDMGDWVSEGYSIQPTEDPDEDTELGLG